MRMSTQDIFIFAEHGSKVKYCPSAVCNQQSVEGLLVGSGVVAALHKGLCSSRSPGLINSPPFARLCL